VSNLTYYWEPRWVRRSITIANGITIETCLDLTTNLLVCPLCVDIDKLCPYKDRESDVVPPANASYFFSEEDLIRHIYAHKEASWRHIVVYAETEEEEEEEQEEEEEEEK